MSGWASWPWRQNQISQYFWPNTSILILWQWCRADCLLTWILELELFSISGRKDTDIKVSKKEGGVMRSQNLVLVPDCGVSCIQVYRSRMEKCIKTQNIYIKWLLMKKLVWKRREKNTPERRLMTVWHQSSLVMISDYKIIPTVFFYIIISKNKPLMSGNMYDNM